MSRIHRFVPANRAFQVLVACAFSIVMALGTPQSVHAEPQGQNRVGIIFDTDMWSDLDDPLALAMLHALADRGEINLLAVTVSTDEPEAAEFVALLDQYYGRPGIPIGRVRGGVNRARFFAQYPENLKYPEVVRSYTREVADRVGADGKPLYPRVRTTDLPDAVALMRRVLAAQPDQSVVLVQVGYSTNLARLLASAPDAVSPLDGRRLVQAKVRLLSLMGGSFADSTFGGRTIKAGAPEFNLLMDAPAAQHLVREWPTDIVFSGFEMGLSLKFPGRAFSENFRYAPRHPIVDAYQYVDRLVRRLDPNRGAPHDRPAWDLTSVLYGARPEHSYFGLSEPGTVTVTADGSTVFTPSPKGRHRYLTVTPEQRPRALEAMVQLATQPPATGVR